MALPSQPIRRCALVLLLMSVGWAQQPPETDTNQRIEAAVRKIFQLPPQVKVEVGARRPSQFPEYRLVTVTVSSDQDKETVDYLVSQDGKTMVRWAPYDLMRFPTRREIMTRIQLDGRPARGNQSAKVTVVSFDDFQCPFCGRMHRLLFSDLIKSYGDRVRFIYKDYPLTEIHPWAIHAAVDANCLAAQSSDAYWEFADYVHENQDRITYAPGNEATPAKEAPEAKDKQRQKKADLATQFEVLDRVTLETGGKRSLDKTRLEACIKAQDDKAVKKSMKEADALGVDATPTLFVNGVKIDGAVPAPELRSVLDQALREAGVQPPVVSTPSPAHEPDKK